MEVIKIEWGMERKPSSACRYNHVIGSTPIGAFLITWKGHKESPAYCIDETPFGTVWMEGAASLQSAKDSAQTSFTKYILGCINTKQQGDMDMDVKGFFEKHQDEYLRFDLIDRPASKCPDICAFLFLSEKFECQGDMISRAEHEIIYLWVELSELNSLTEREVIFLRRCGVSFDSGANSLIMFK